MPTEDIRISDWSLLASAGTTAVLQFTSPDALTSLSVYTGGTTTDVDDLTDADEHAGTLSGADLIATVNLVVPTGESVALRLVVNGAVQSVGRLHPSTAGTPNPDNTITLVAGVNEFDLTILGVVQSGGVGGGAPTDATYLVTTANGTLSAEVVVGATPGGELGGTWAAPTVDATHSGSSHAAVQAAAEATAAADATAKADAKVAQTITNGVTTSAPSQDAVFDALALKADDSAVAHDTGDETWAGVKTFSSDPLIPDEAYDATAWNGSLEPPTKNAVRDKIEALTPADVDLGNVDNTSDANKPVSTAQQTALDLKANLASPALTGTPTAPTPSQGDNDTSIATTAFVQTEAGLLIPKALLTTNGNLISRAAGVPVEITRAALAADAAFSALYAPLLAAPQTARVDTAQTTTSATYVDLATTGPAVTIVTGAIALVHLGALFDHSTTGISLMGFDISGATTVAASDAYSLSSQGTQESQVGITYLVTGLTPGSNTFTAKYRTSVATATFANRSICVEAK